MQDVGRILVADDHTLFRRGLKLLLVSLFEGVEVVEAGTVDEALNKLDSEESYDLLLLDLAMPGMEDFEGLKRLQACRPDLPTIMLSAMTAVDNIVESIRLGARGYILKSCSDESLKHAISLVLSGEIYVPAQVLSEPREDLQSFEAVSSPSMPADNPLSSLTERQLEVVALLMDGCSNKEIGRALGLLESTVKAHVKVVLTKLNAANRTQAAMTAASLGLQRGHAADHSLPAEPQP